MLDRIYNMAEELETDDTGAIELIPGVLLVFEGFTEACLAIMDSHGKSWEQQNEELDQDFDKTAHSLGYSRALIELTWNGAGTVAFKAFEW